MTWTNAPKIWWTTTNQTRSRIGKISTSFGPFLMLLLLLLLHTRTPLFGGILSCSSSEPSSSGCCYIFGRRTTTMDEDGVIIIIIFYIETDQCTLRLARESQSVSPSASSTDFIMGSLSAVLCITRREQVAYLWKANLHYTRNGQILSVPDEIIWYICNRLARTPGLLNYLYFSVFTIIHTQSILFNFR